ANVGGSGFRIDGAAAGDHAGVGLAPAGDVNSDGLADVLVGAPGVDVPGASPDDPGANRDNELARGAGAAYVVFGKTDSNPVELATLGTGGYRISGAAEGDQAGTSVASVADM